MSWTNLIVAVVAAFVVTQIAIFTTTVYLHRALSHRALTVRGPAAVPFRAVIWMTTGMRPREWVAVHRKHHAATDAPDRLDRLAFDYSLAGLGLGTTVLVLTMWALGFGLLTGLLAAGLHAIFYVMLSDAINAIGHTKGKQPYANSATNLQALALITAGEGLHNNHHAAPTSARFALNRAEIDPGWWLVRALVKLHFAQVRHEHVHLKTAA